MTACWASASTQAQVRQVVAIRYILLDLWSVAVAAESERADLRR